MSIELYEASIKTYLQILDSTNNVLTMGKDFFLKTGINPDDILNYQLSPDMLPLSFQLNSIRHHSLGAIQGIQQGLFQPPPTLPAMNYDEFIQFISDARDQVAIYSKEEINSLSGKALLFKVAGMEMPFTAENFVLSFSLPNFYFHATTAYDILRTNGVILSKRDFLGSMRLSS